MILLTVTLHSPAAYYSDLCCERGRCYINDFLNTGDDKSSNAGAKKNDREQERERVFNTATEAWGEGIHPDLRESMFYI
jgi:eukaryotic translation initiation factor 2C